jgi:pimeloyl-ACP methyl ester carboxylesterase
MGNLKNAYAIIIGVGNDLPVTVKDATAIYNILADENLAGYPPENITLLTDEKATRKGILNAFDALIETVDGDSSVLLYYSGHGGTYSDNTFLKKENWKPEEENQKYFHLCPYDYDPVNYKTTWVKAEEVKERISKIKSRRLIFFLDCCHAAGMTKNATTAISESKNQKLSQADGLAQKLDDGRGMSIVSSCREDQLSYILEGDSNSLYTKCMIEVLKGKNKTDLTDPYVRISEVVQYIFKKVPEENPDQNPYANLQIYDDFILSYVPGIAENKTNKELKRTLGNKSKTVNKELVTKFRETERANSVVLFVHGFSGEATATFAEIPSYLMEDSKMDGWDLFPVGYSDNIVPEMGKNVWASTADIQRNSDYLVTSIRHKYGKYKRIAIVAHGLGGIVAERAILDLAPQERQRLSHLILFGTPSNGLSEKGLENLCQNNLRELSENSDYIQSMRKRWQECFPSGYPFFFRAVAATKDNFVPVASSLEPFAKEYRAMVEGDHFSMVHVEDKDNDSYGLIVNSLTDNVFYNHFSASEEINIALGEYDEVIKKLLPNSETLDSKGLEQLIFALEGADRAEEAMEILDGHPQAKENSNLLGIIGGRYKRKYLNTFSAEDGANSFKYYAEGLKIAEDRGDKKQIYYLAINLAFLSILMKQDDMAMTDYATKALEAAKKDPFNSLWKLATVAEANLYLGELHKAKEYYEKAAQMCGIREKISIYTNAYNAYTCLMQTDSPEDDFIKFLKTNFLS